VAGGAVMSGEMFFLTLAAVFWWAYVIWSSLGSHRGGSAFHNL
jgi:hypothetical protein